jgi:hypothetical protein
MADLINVNSKSNAVDPDNPTTDEQCSATEFNEVVTKTNAAITEFNGLVPNVQLNKDSESGITLVANTNYDVSVGSTEPFLWSVVDSTGQDLSSVINPVIKFNDAGTWKLRLKSSTGLSNVVCSWLSV